MATTTLEVLRQRLSEAIGDFISGTTSSAGNGGGTTLVDATLINDFPVDDSINSWWLIQTSGDNDGEIRRVSDYTASTGTVTVQSAFTNQVASSVTYELHRINPKDKLDALNAASETLFPRVYVPLRDESIVVDNVLPNHSFENWTSNDPDNWGDVATPTTVQQTGGVLHGSSHLQIIASINNEGVEYTVTNSITEYLSKTIEFRAWARSTTANSAKLRLDFGTSTETSDSVPSSNEWTKVELNTTVPSGATQIIAQLLGDTATVNFDLASLVIEPIYRYSLPSAFRRTPHRVLVQRLDDEPEGRYLPLSGFPTSHRILRIEGQGNLSSVTSDSDTIEIDEEFVRLLVQQAKLELGEMLHARTENALYLSWITQAERRLATMTHLRMPVMTREDSESWYVDEDSTGKTLVLTGKP